MFITGILLAAGYSHRFGTNKLLYPLSDGTPIAITAVRKLSAAVDKTLVVVSPESTELTKLLHENLQIVTCAEAKAGMGASIACGVKASLEADAWIIALADMPFIQLATIQKLVNLLHQGKAVVAPKYQERRGHPVGFSQTFRTQLTQLTGDMGARKLLNSPEVTLFPCEDAGIHQDIDTQQDINYM